MLVWVEVVDKFKENDGELEDEVGLENDSFEIDPSPGENIDEEKVDENDPGLEVLVGGHFALEDEFDDVDETDEIDDFFDSLFGVELVEVLAEDVVDAVDSFDPDVEVGLVLAKQDLVELDDLALAVLVQGVEQGTVVVLHNPLVFIVSQNVEVGLLHVLEVPVAPAFDLLVYYLLALLVVQLKPVPNNERLALLLERRLRTNLHGLMHLAEGIQLTPSFLDIGVLYLLAQR